MKREERLSLPYHRPEARKLTEFLASSLGGARLLQEKESSAVDFFSPKAKQLVDDIKNAPASRRKRRTEVKKLEEAEEDLPKIENRESEPATEEFANAAVQSTTASASEPASESVSGGNVDSLPENVQSTSEEMDKEDDALPDVITRNQMEESKIDPHSKEMESEEKENELPNVLTQNQLSQISESSKQSISKNRLEEKTSSKPSSIAFTALHSSNPPTLSSQPSIKSKLLSDAVLRQQPRLSGGNNFDTISFDSDDEDDDVKAKPELPGKELFTRFLAHSKKEPKKDKKHVVKMKILRKEPTLTSEDSQSQQFAESLQIQVKMLLVCVVSV